MLYQSHKKRKDSLKGNLDRVLLAILVPRLPQHTLNVNTECAGKSEWPKQVFFTCDQLFGALIHLNFIILILMFFIYDAWCKLCNIWLLLCENNSWSITIPELNTGGKYCCNYYSRQGDRWQFEKAN